jgi:short-subunit dehydrogenase
MKTIVVTGCSTGMGAAIAAALAHKGHLVFATARDTSTLDALVKAHAANIRPYRLDVTNQDQIAKFRDFVLEVTGDDGPNVLINNAGIGAMGPIEEVSMDVARACLETNVLGLLAVTQAFLPAMRARRRGHIINVSSIVGRIVMPYEGVYVASKHAVEGLSDALRFEVAPFGIDVTIIEPGAVQTEFESRGNLQMNALPLKTTPYHDHVKGFEAARGQAFVKAPIAAQAAQHFVKIVEATRPPTRFMFPGQPRFVKWAFGSMPDRLTDALKRRVFNVPRYAKPN